MKRIFILCLILSSIHSKAQIRQRNDALYYLIDTIKTPVNERVWKIEANDQFKSYTLNCACLKNNGMPRFFYSLTEVGNPAQVLSKSGLKGIKFISLPELIIKSKELLDTSLKSSAFYFVEPYGKNYIVHHVDLRNSAVQIVSPPDVLKKIAQDTTPFKANGLIRINAKDIAHYQNQAVITDGSVINTKVPDGYYGKVLLFVGDDYPNQQFTIVIKGINRDNFDAPELHYKNKKVKVTGIVTTYEGKPAIEITKENQIQVTGKF